MQVTFTQPLVIMFRNSKYPFHSDRVELPAEVANQLAAVYIEQQDEGLCRLITFINQIKFRDNFYLHDSVNSDIREFFIIKGMETQVQD